ncbi:amidohydrolase [Mucilaginibacter pedocola]|uniref:Transcriptional regulator n=1 Tax=Mucilaginibacter pedocola TaxID=1792845 RepID=A0A1S9PBQ3_9SPHI|nr:amidohydrolase [Mucilaginibacter pedocola]OOQ58416.1 transcriptional regulator [Mucilaginibacter pedocola]
MKKAFTLLATAIFSLGLHAQSVNSSAGADMIVYHAKITTQTAAQPEASALAVKAGRIYAVGADNEILSLKDGHTKLIDADGRRLIPGLEDSHMHPLNERNFTQKVKWDGVPTLKRALEMLTEQSARTPEGQWVKVTGAWSPYQFKENREPTIEELNKAVPDKLLWVQYAYNKLWLNKPAMKFFGIGTPKFKADPGTVLQKDSKGNYTGIIEANTFVFVALDAMMPTPTAEEEISSLEYLIRDLNHFGLTTVIENSSVIPYPQGHAPIEALIKANRMNIRFPFVDLGFNYDPNKSWVDTEIERVTRTSPISPGQNLNPNMEHGHEYEGTGEVISPEVHDHENFDKPAIIIPYETMKKYAEEYIRKFIEKRIPFRAHMSYNENLTPFLDAFEEVVKTTPLDGMRWAVEHAETLSDENIARIKKLGGGIALDNKMALHGESFAKTYGLDKAMYTPRFGALKKSGIPLSLTTDAFRVSPANPWTGISWAVTGKSVSGKVILAEDNRLTREEALKLYTTGAAWFENEENEKGRIAPGNLADFVLLSDDYFTIPEDDIKGLTSVLTVLGGKVVWGSGKYSGLSPQLGEVLPSWSPIKYFGGYYFKKQ